ncbi:MAG: hypothetical protein J6K14_08415 [Clostridia bacterium]|nr:hypothetical protein [Clostridia bacterium]
MTAFITKKKRENEPGSFSVWMRKHGTELKNELTPDKAATIKAKSAPTHGTNAEALFDKGLTGSGYARFLADEADRSFKAAKQNYDRDAASTLEKNLSGYARYLTSHREAQDTLRKQMIERIGRGESFDTEGAYQIAIAAGLTEENARAAATLGVAAAKERATSRLLEMILEQRLQAARVTEYARSMGFNDEELERFAAYAKQINSTKVPSQLPGDLFD